MKKNNKGFTLIELLAVIVVLAVIMVIATQQISKVLKQNTAKSFQSSLEMAVKQAKMYNTSNGNYPTNDEEWKEVLDYDVNEYTVSASGSTITLTAVATGKFKDVKCIDFGVSASSNECTGTGTGTLKNGYTFNETDKKISFTIQ